MNNEQLTMNRFSNGSALILAVVLTSLLAIVGVTFIMFARVEKISTSAVTANKELNLAVDTVIADISRQLALDVPHYAPNYPQEYYDYPDPCNFWLANLEPYEAGVKNYRWRHISDVYENLGAASSDLQAKVIPDYNQNITPAALADADGDGVADSRWVILPDVNSSKGKPIFAAIRIVDNGGMLNVNTAYKFDPGAADANKIDGSTQMQINLAALSQRGVNGSLAAAAATLQSWRDPNNLSGYEPNVIWNYGGPKDKYTPFDISDEVELRNRFLLDNQYIDTRIEDLWADAFWKPNLEVPVDSNSKITEWFWRAQHDITGPNDIYSYRHIGTIYSMDRIIRPDGIKMLNVNQAAKIKDANSIRNAIRESLLDADPLLGFPQADVNATQIAVNLTDFVDDDNNVVTTLKDVRGNTHYGFERPCIYISELAQSFYDPCDAFSPIHPPDPNSTDPNVHRSYAIELHKPYIEDNDPCGWQVSVYDATGLLRMVVPIIWTGTGRFHVLLHEDVNAPLRNAINPPDGATGVSPDVVLMWPKVGGAISYDVYFGDNFNSVRDANNTPGLWPEFKGNQTVRFYDPPGVLDMNTTYYWRIDDINSSFIINKGDVWSFTTGAPNSQIVIADINFVSSYLIVLRREVNSVPIVVDSVVVPAADLSDPNRWWIDDVNTHIAGYSFQRDIHPHKCIRRLWDRWLSRGGFPTIGGFNFFVWPVLPSPFIQAHPENKPFTNVGEIGMLLLRSAYSENPATTIGPADTEYTTRVNLANPNYQQLFKYLTVFDPTAHGANPNETRIKGRININTAPWYVIAQLPWVSQRINVLSNYVPDKLAQAIVAYRDKSLVPGVTDPNYIYRSGNPGFTSIGQLDNVVAATNRDYNIDYYARDGNDLLGFPDLTPGGILGDDAPDDFEERDVIFSRISNLVTVRSDVFTAYILVRIGVDGPQKRVVAILDRSETKSPAEKVKVIAIQQSPEPR
jgi:hypothetical protein